MVLEKKIQKIAQTICKLGSLAILILTKVIQIRRWMCVCFFFFFNVILKQVHGGHALTPRYTLQEWHLQKTQVKGFAYKAFFSNEKQNKTRGA